MGWTARPGGGWSGERASERGWQGRRSTIGASELTLRPAALPPHPPLARGPKGIQRQSGEAPPPQPAPAAPPRWQRRRRPRRQLGCRQRRRRRLLQLWPTLQQLAPAPPRAPLPPGPPTLLQSLREGARQQAQATGGRPKDPQNATQACRRCELVQGELPPASLEGKASSAGGGASSTRASSQPGTDAGTVADPMNSSPYPALSWPGPPRLHPTACSSNEPWPGRLPAGSHPPSTQPASQPACEPRCLPARHPSARPPTGDVSKQAGRLVAHVRLQAMLHGCSAVGRKRRPGVERSEGVKRHQAAHAWLLGCLTPGPAGTPRTRLQRRGVWR